MKLQVTLIAAVAAGLWATTPMAQGTSNPTGSYVDSVPMYSASQPWPSSGPTYSPNPNKAQNSDMRTQGGYGSYVYPYGTATYVYPAQPIWIEPTASRRGVMTYGPTYVPGTVYYYTPGDVMYVTPSEIQYGPTGPTHTPNPNRVQNNGVRTQY